MLMVLDCMLVCMVVVMRVREFGISRVLVVFCVVLVMMRVSGLKVVVIVIEVMLNVMRLICIMSMWL